MNKRWLWILLGVVAFFAVLFSGAVAGAGLTYLALQVRPARAAQDVLFEVINQESGDYESGILVLRIEQDSPAAQAGIQRGDIILKVDDQEVNTSIEFMEILDKKSAGDEITLTVQHCETTEELTVELEERNGHIYLGLQPGRSRIIDARPFARDGDNLPFNRSAFVITRVVPDSPAAESGLIEGDFIIAVDGEEVQSKQDLADVIHSYQPGEKITLTVQQPGAGDPRQVKVNLGENPDEKALAYLGIEYMSIPGFMGDAAEGRRHFQFQFPKPGGETLPLPHLPEEFMPFMHEFPELPEGVEQAVIISSVAPNSPAEESGLEPGDVVTSIDGEGVSDHETFSEAILNLEPGDEITLTVYRSGEEEALEIEVELGEHPEVDGRAYLGVEISGFFQFDHLSPGHEGENPFHFEFQFPWKGENWSEEHIDPVPGDEA
ncbi:PDZ domain-containing protein [Chloroflexota bacterium]